jgi:predicted GH43/DUF377 family glycosyl hydrolase
MYSGNPILTHEDETSWESLDCAKPNILWDGDKYRMWYAGGRDRIEGSNLAGGIGYATSSDGINWETYDDNPIMISGSADKWDYNWIEPSSILYDGSLYKMWYSNIDWRISSAKIGYATSPDGINWTKDTVNSPIMGLSVSQAFWQPCVLQEEDSLYKMWFNEGEYNSNFGFNVVKIAYAESNDGSHPH